MVKVNEIYPLLGLGEITFSLSQNELIEKLGKPDSVDEYDEVMVFLYSALGVSIVFALEEGNYLMSSIELDKDIFTLWGETIINKGSKEIMTLLKKYNCPEPRVIKDSECLYIFCDQYNLDFELENDKVTVIYVKR